MDIVKNIDGDLIGGLSYQRATSINLLIKSNDKVKPINSREIMSQLPNTKDNKISKVMLDNFDTIYGEITNEKEELILLVDSKNRIPESILKTLGFENETVTFEELLNKEIKVVLNDDYYKKIGNIYTINQDLDKLYNNEKTITLKINAIIRGKEDSDFAKMSGAGLLFNNELMEYIIENNDNSSIVKAQKDSNYNVLTAQKFDLDTEEGKQEKELILSALGADTTPLIIQIYPKDFDSKDAILESLDKYNEGKTDEDKIIYLDQAKLNSSFETKVEQTKKADKYTKEQLNSLFSNLDEVEI